VFKPSLLFPKAFIKNGRSSGSLLIGSGLPVPPGYPIGTVAQDAANYKKITAAGTAPDFPLWGGSPDSL
jgi:hypothetical protein